MPPRRPLPGLALVPLLLTAAPALGAGPLDVTVGGAWAKPLGVLSVASTPAPALWAGASARTDSGGVLGVRLDGGFTSLKKGDEVALVPPGGGASTSWATVTQRLMWLTAGPELGFRAGAARVHLHATAGLGTVRAHASVRSEGPAGTRFPDAFSDPPGGVTFAWTAGGGVRIPLAGGVGLDLGGAFVGFGRSWLVLDPPLTRGANGLEVFHVGKEIPSLAQVRVGLAYTPPPRQLEPLGPPAPRPAKPKRVKPVPPATPKP